MNFREKGSLKEREYIDGVKVSNMNDFVLGEEIKELLVSSNVRWGNFLKFSIHKREKAVSFLEKFKQDLKSIDSHKIAYYGFDLRIVSLLRDLFWSVIDKCRVNNSVYVNGYEFYSGICSKIDYENMFDSDLFCSYMCEVRIDHDIKSVGLLNECGHGIYNDILKTDASLMTDEMIKAYRLKLEVVKRLEDRVKGAVIQRVNLNGQLNNTVSYPKRGGLSELSIDEMNERIRSLQEEIGDMDTSIDISNGDRDSVVKALTLDVLKSKKDYEF